MHALKRELGVEFVTLLHQYRRADFEAGKRLGKKDHIVKWAKPQRTSWLDQETYDRLPEHLEIRELEVNIDVRGYRVETLVIVTSLLDDHVFTRNDIAEIYRCRWRAELQLRDIKTTMKLDILRRKSPSATRQELWTGLLTYNLIRQSMLQSALAGECVPHELSFASSMQMLSNTWVVAAAYVMDTTTSIHVNESLASLRVMNGQSHRVANRLNRVEPRAVKRRPDPIALLKEPRKVARAKLMASSPK
jgi:hypothetical protein